MDEGDGGDRNEAISAVADEGFLGEEDDDYEDLYNDVNVGEGFLQSLRRNEDVVFRNGEEDKKIESAAESRGVSIPGFEGATGGGGSGGGGGGGGGGGAAVGVGEVKFEQDAGASAIVSRGSASARLEGFQDPVFRGNELALKGPGPVLAGGGGMRVDLGPSSTKMSETEGQQVNNPMPSMGMNQQSQIGFGNVANDSYARQQGGGGGVGVGGNANANGGSGSGGGGGGGGGTILFVGDLHWWTTDAELEAELSKYGSVKEVKFFDEKASGKSKGYCQVEFYDPGAATVCKEGMNGHIFNGRPCVVAFASPYSVRRMGEAQVNKNQQVTQGAVAPGRRGVGDAGGRSGGNAIATGGNYQGGNYQGGNYQGGEGNRNYGRGNWGRGGAQGMGNRGQVGPMRNRIGGMGGRGIMGNAGNGFGQGLGTNPPLLHPQTMMNQGFDPGYGAHMGRMAGYGGFPAAPTAPFSGILSSFPPVGNVGLAGVAPHVNPAFFGRGMPANGMGMMPATGVEGHGMGMWSDPNAAGWVGDEHGGRAGECSYGDDAASDHQYGDGSHDRGGWPNAMKEKERVSERDWSGASDRRYRDDREMGSDRDIPREKDMGHDDWSERRQREDRETVRDRDRDRDREREHDRERERSRDRGRERDRDRERDRRDGRDRYLDHHRYRDRESEHDDEWDRGRSSMTHSKSRLSQEEDQRSRSRDAEYGKRRRLPSE